MILAQIISNESGNNGLPWLKAPHFWQEAIHIHGSPKFAAGHPEHSYHAKPECRRLAHSI